MLGLPWVKLYRVEGESMTPTLKPGVLVLGSGLIKPKVGHVAVVKKEPVSIKRIKEISTKGIWLEGDNKALSTDSRQYGHVQTGSVKAIIFLRVR